MSERYARLKPLFGDDFSKLRNAKVLLLGVGGVGGVCLECLYRSGVEDITIIDCDSFDTTNQNRQLYSQDHLGESKVKALQHHYPKITPIHQRIDEEWVWGFDFEPYDVVIDAIDDRGAKLALAQKCYKKLLSSFGSAKRLDPTQVQVADISKTYGDRFGSKIRYELKKRGFNKKYKVVFSPEEAQTKEMGSFMAVTGTFGFTLCAEAIKMIQKRN